MDDKNWGIVWVGWSMWYVFGSEEDKQAKLKLLEKEKKVFILSVSQIFSYGKEIMNDV